MATSLNISMIIVIAILVLFALVLLAVGAIVLVLLILANKKKAPAKLQENNTQQLSADPNVPNTDSYSDINYDSINL